MMGRGCVWLGRGGACMGEEGCTGRGHAWLGMGGACVVGQGATHAPPYGWQAGSTHPTGMLSSSQ